jgi:WD40 repeat protein
MSKLFYYFSSFITGSYDRTCKVWDTASGEELHTLDGHRNVVYAIGFNNPYGYVIFGVLWIIFLFRYFTMVYIKVIK